MTKTYTLRIVQDNYPQSPREWDNIGIMACKHRHYNLGDKNHGIHFNDFNSWEEVAEYAKKELGALVVLPLYLYDHSGITMRTTPFSCRWDSGQVGVIYTTKKQCDELGTPTDDKEKLEKYLTGEVETYDKYLTGDVWGYEIKEITKCNLGHEHEEVIDSCYGFFGEDEAREAGQKAMPKN